VPPVWASGDLGPPEKPPATAVGIVIGAVHPNPDAIAEDTVPMEVVDVSALGEVLAPFKTLASCEVLAPFMRTTTDHRPGMASAADGVTASFAAHVVSGDG
jgi:hypothetical protein